jgi:hypothetical protein
MSLLAQIFIRIERASQSICIAARRLPCGKVYLTGQYSSCLSARLSLALFKVEGLSVMQPYLDRRFAIAECQSARSEGSKSEIHNRQSAMRRPTGYRLVVLTSWDRALNVCNAQIASLSALEPAKPIRSTYSHRKTSRGNLV